MTVMEPYDPTNSPDPAPPPAVEVVATVPTESPPPQADGLTPPQPDPAVSPAPRPPRGGRGFAGLLAVSLLSAVLASGGTAAILTASLARTPAPAAATPTSNATVVNQTTVVGDDITGIVAAAKNSVVTITANGLGGNGLSPFQVPTSGVGSGVILTADGYILTNRHVVANSQSLSVALYDGRQFDARVIKISTTTDLALIKIDATGLQPATIGDSTGIKVGQAAIAIGSPLGTFTETVTRGIVSGLDRSVTVTDEVTRR